MADQNDEQPVHIQTDQARAGATPGMTRYILAASLILIIGAFLAIYLL